MPGAAGAFEVEIDGDLVFSRHAEGRFPDLQELKEAIAARLS